MKRSVGAVVVAVLAGSLAVSGFAWYTAAGRTVTLIIDGKPRTVSTFADTVGDLLNRTDIKVGEHDLVVPDLSDGLADHATVIVRTARPMKLTVDGTTVTDWVYSNNVSGALDELGVSRQGAVISAAATTPIPVTGLAVTVDLAHDVVIDDGGAVKHVTSSASTVGALLAEQGVPMIGPKDTVSPKLTDRPEDGTVITINRVDSDIVDIPTTIPFDTVYQNDDTLPAGTSQTTQSGRNGTMTTKFRIKSKDGVEVSRTEISETMTVQPRNQIIAVGTKQPVIQAAADPQTNGAQNGGSGANSSARAASGRSQTQAVSPRSDRLNWGALAQCESGGNPRALSPGGTYRGLYQFSIGTWRAVGGSGDPAEASASTQTAMAQRLYASSGRGAWPVCGSRL